MEEDTASFYGSDHKLYGQFNGYGEDIELVMELAGRSSGGPVLELGCTTLRAAIPLARNGHVVHALDDHPKMIQWARDNLQKESLEIRKRVTIHKQDIRDFRLRERFGFVFLLDNSFLKLLNGFDQVLTLRTVKDHMLPGARIMIDVFKPEMEYPEETLDHNASIDIDRSTGSKVVKYFSRRYDLETKRVYLTRYYDVFFEGEYRRIEVPFELRHMEHYDFLELFKKSGFKVIAVYGDHTKGPLRDDSKRLIYIIEEGHVF